MRESLQHALQGGEGALEQTQAGLQMKEECDRSKSSLAAHHLLHTHRSLPPYLSAVGAAATAARATAAAAAS